MKYYIIEDSNGFGEVSERIAALEDGCDLVKMGAVHDAPYTESGRHKSYRILAGPFSSKEAAVDYLY